MSDLASKQPSSDNAKPAKLSSQQIEENARKLGRDWKVVDGKQIEKTYSFKDFRQALTFTNRIGEIAESVNHHPDIYLTWGKVRVSISTHSVGGLTENDFILAAKFEAK